MRFYQLEILQNLRVLQLYSQDPTNRLTRECVLALTAAISELSAEARPLVITGNPKFFSAGADLHEIAALSGPAAYEFSKMGQALMNAIEDFPARVYAAVHGYCMGADLIWPWPVMAGLLRLMPCLGIAGPHWD